MSHTYYVKPLAVWESATHYIVSNVCEPQDKAEPIALFPKTVKSSKHHAKLFRQLLYKWNAQNTRYIAETAESFKTAKCVVENAEELDDLLCLTCKDTGYVPCYCFLISGPHACPKCKLGLEKLKDMPGHS